MVTAAQGIDTEDFLRHIAWTDVVKPELERAKRILADRLVQAVLKPLAEGQESQPQIAGKLFGIDFAIRTIEDIVRKGRLAGGALAEVNIHLQ